MHAILPGRYIDAVVLIPASQALYQLSHLPASPLFLRETGGRGVLSSAKTSLSLCCVRAIQPRQTVLIEA